MPPLTTTYAKRSVKRKNNIDSDFHTVDSTTATWTSTSTTLEGRSDDDELLLQSTRTVVQKKRRVDHMRHAAEPSKSQTESPISTEENTPEPAPKSKPAAVNGTPRKGRIREGHLPKSRPVPEKESSFSSSIKGLPFEEMSSLQVSPSKAGSPTKLAKRMLARSRTETSIEGPSNPFSLADKRTPSLPIIPSVQDDLPLSQSPSRSPTRGNSLTDVSASSTALLSVPTLASSSTSTTVSRTYAGRSRSYLVPLGPATGLEDVEEDDEFSRESYATLRRRWGVDESEDDPHFFNIDEDQQSNQSPAQSPTKARTYGGRGTITPGASPSKGKSKAGIQQLRAPELPPNMMNPLKSITELRNKGESRRFLDEVAYLLDGMAKSQGTGLIRSSALEIVIKLCDHDFFRKSKAADVLSKVYDLFLDVGVGRGDKILDTLFVAFAILVSKDPSSLNELAVKAPVKYDPKGKGKGSSGDLVDILFLILDTTSSKDCDPLAVIAPGSVYTDAELRVAGIGKKEKLTMATILSTIRNKSGLFPAVTKITTPLLITRVLQSLPPSLISQNHFPSLLKSLRQSLRLLEEWRSGVPSKLRLDEGIGFENVHAHLRLLDLHLLGQWRPDDEDLPSSVNEAALLSARREWLVSSLIALGVQAETTLIRDIEGNRSDREGAAKCLECVLRVLVSLTHGDEGWARSVALGDAWALRFLMRIIARAGEDIASGRDSTINGIVKKEEGQEEKVETMEEEERVDPRETKAKSLDRLCLSLALLTNLVQAIGEVKDVIRETYLDPSCRMQDTKCLNDCSCYRATNASILDILVQLYVRQGIDLPRVKQENEDEESLQVDADASFLRGHLAVLFGLCMRDNMANQKALLGLLPGPQSNPKVKLNRLVDQARQFVAFFHIIEGDGQDTQRESSSRFGTEILRFLEELRDGASKEYIVAQLGSNVMSL